MPSDAGATQAVRNPDRPPTAQSRESSGSSRSGRILVRRPSAANAPLQSATTSLVGSISRKVSRVEKLFPRSASRARLESIAVDGNASRSRSDSLISPQIPSSPAAPLPPAPPTHAPLSLRASSPRPLGLRSTPATALAAAPVSFTGTAAGSASTAAAGAGAGPGQHCSWAPAPAAAPASFACSLASASYFLSDFHARLLQLPAASDASPLASLAGGGGGGGGAAPFWAAAVRLHIRGLSSLVERFLSKAAMASFAEAQEQGPRLLGADLNAFFARILRSAKKHGGDVHHLFDNSLVVFVHAGEEAGLAAAARAALSVAAEVVGQSQHGGLAAVASLRAAPGSLPSQYHQLAAERIAAADRLQLLVDASVAAGRFSCLPLSGAGPEGIDPDGAEGEELEGSVLCVWGPPLARLVRAGGLLKPWHIGVAPEVTQLLPTFDGDAAAALQLNCRTPDHYSIYDVNVPEKEEKSWRGIATASRFGADRDSDSDAERKREGSSSPRGGKAFMQLQNVLRRAGGLFGSLRRSSSPVSIVPSDSELKQQQQQTQELSASMRPAPGSPIPPDDFFLHSLPEDIRTCLENQSCPESEVRSVVCACVSLAAPAAPAAEAGLLGSPPRDDRERERMRALQRGLRLVAAAVAASGGVPRDAALEGASLSIFITWGAVGVPRPEDAFRAVSAALRIRAGFRDEGLGPVSVGVATGPVYTGVVGDEAARRALFLCLGRPVSSALRLALAAAGSIYIDTATCERVAEDFVIEAANFPFRGEGAAGQAKLKAPACFRRALVDLADLESEAAGSGAGTGSGSGSGGLAGGPDPEADSVASSRALTREEAAGRLAAAAASGESLVYGRREARAQLVELLTAARCGEYLRGGAASGHTLLVEGDRGSGKSTLVAEAERLCEIVDLPFLSLQPDPKEMYPYEAVRLLLRGIILPGRRGSAASHAVELDRETVVEPSPRAESATPGPEPPASASASERRQAAAALGAWLQSAASGPASPLGGSTRSEPQGAGEGGPSSPRDGGFLFSMLAPSAFDLGPRAAGAPEPPAGPAPRPRSVSPAESSSYGSPATAAGAAVAAAADRELYDIEEPESESPESSRSPPRARPGGRGSAGPRLSAFGDGRLFLDALAFLKQVDPQLASGYNAQVLPGGSPQLSSAGGSRARRRSRARSDAPSLGSRGSSDARTAAGALVDFSMAASSEGYRVFSFLCRLLEGVARSSAALVIIDDFCDLDAASQKCLAFVAQTGRVCMLATSRRVPASTVSLEFNMLRQSRQTRHAELRPWSSLDDVAGFVSFVLRIEKENLSPVLARALAERTGGAPRFLRELVLHLVQAGFVELDNGRALASAALLQGGELDSRSPEPSPSAASPTPRHSVGPHAGAEAGTAAAEEARRGASPAPPGAAGIGSLLGPGSAEPPSSGERSAAGGERRRGPEMSPEWERERAQKPALNAKALPLPESLLPSSILVELERIPPVAAGVLKLASVLGARFETGLAQYAIDGVVEWSSIVDCLKVLERHEVLACVQTGDGLFEYVFTERAHVEVLRKTVDAVDAALVAWRAAEYLSRTSERRGKAAAALVAGYYTAAGASSFAEPYWEIAAEAAVEAGRPAEALALLPAERLPPALGLALRPRGGSTASAASVAAGEALGAARRLELRSRALFALGRPEAALEAVQACLAELGVRFRGKRPLPLPVLFAALSAARPREPGGSSRAALQAAAGASGSLQAALQRATEAPPEQRRADILVAALGTHVSILAHRGDSAAAAESALALVRLARRWSPPPERADALATAASALSRARFGRRATEALLAGRPARRPPCPPASSPGPLPSPGGAGDGGGPRGAFGAIDAEARSLAARLRAMGKHVEAGEVALAHALAHLLRGQAGPASALYASLEAFTAPPTTSSTCSGRSWAARRPPFCSAPPRPGAPGVGVAAGEYPPPCTYSDEAGSGHVAELIERARAAFGTERFPLEALALSAADAACALREGRLQLALLPLLMAGEALADLLERGYTEAAAEVSWRRSSSRRRLLHGGPLLASFADRNRAPVRDYGETEAGWQRHLRAALRDLVDALRPEAARFPAAAPAYELLEGRWQELSGSRGAALRLYRRAAGLARAAGARLLEEMAAAQTKRHRPGQPDASLP
eukprot:tig00000405_g495.t1